MDSRKTNDEDIADNAGFLVAFNAYLDKLRQQNWFDLNLAHLNYTPRQMFWISLATAWCKKNSKWNGDDHSPNGIRINNVLSNLKEFSDDFKCSSNSFMHFSKRCEGVR